MIVGVCAGGSARVAAGVLIGITALVVAGDAGPGREQAVSRTTQTVTVIFMRAGTTRLQSENLLGAPHKAPRVGGTGLEPATSSV